MTKTTCPGGCEKRFISEAFAVKHADEAHPEWRTPKRKGWRTPYGFGDFTDAITYDEACVRMKELVDTIHWPERTG